MMEFVLAVMIIVVVIGGENTIAQHRKNFPDTPAKGIFVGRKWWRFGR